MIQLKDYTENYSRIKDIKELEQNKNYFFCFYNEGNSFVKELKIKYAFTNTYFYAEEKVPKDIREVYDGRNSYWGKDYSRPSSKSEIKRIVVDTYTINDYSLTVSEWGMTSISEDGKEKKPNLNHKNLIFTREQDAQSYMMFLRETFGTENLED